MYGLTDDPHLNGVPTHFLLEELNRRLERGGPSRLGEMEGRQELRNERLWAETTRNAQREEDARKYRTYDVHGGGLHRAAAPQQSSNGARPVDEPVGRAAGANAYQHGGDHYQRGGANWQHWDLVARFGMDYFVGCATKYVARHRFKGQGIQDLEKALHYLDKRTELGFPEVSQPVDMPDLLHFCYMNNLNAAEMRALRLIISWDFEEARVAILELRDAMGPQAEVAPR